MKSTPSTKATSTEAKAKAKAEASVVATAAALMAEADDVTRFHLVAAATVGTVAEHLAAASDAATFVAKAEADAFRATAAARQAIGARLYRAFVARVTEADANAEVKTAADVTFTTLMAAVIVGATEDSWKTMTSRPIARGWSTLKEDYATFVHTTGDAWMDAYLIHVGESTPTVRGYLAFAKEAEAEANAAEERGETSQARSARTAKARREANVAEATRQADAAAKAKADREAKAEEAKTKATNEATALVANVLARPSANVVPGVEVTNAVVAALSVSTLRRWPRCSPRSPTTPRPRPRPRPRPPRPPRPRPRPWPMARPRPRRPWPSTTRPRRPRRWAPRPRPRRPRPWPSTRRSSHSRPCAPRPPRDLAWVTPVP